MLIGRPIAGHRPHLELKASSSDSPTASFFTNEEYVSLAIVLRACVWREVRVPSFAIELRLSSPTPTARFLSAAWQCRAVSVNDLERLDRLHAREYKSEQ